MHSNIASYNTLQSTQHSSIFDLLARTIDGALPEAESKVWHGHPVWFIDGNPIVGYSLQKKGVRLMFWSGADFEEEALNVVGVKFKDASIFYQTVEEISLEEISRWIIKSKEIQWDYKNIVKRKGQLIRLK